MLVVIDARESGTSTGRYVDKLVEYLSQLEPSFDVTLLTKSSRCEFLGQLASNFQVIASDFREFSFAEQLAFKKQLDGLSPVLVHFLMTQQPVRYKGRVITTVHDLTTARFSNPAKNQFVYKFKQLVYRWLIKRVARKSLHIITPSQFVKSDLVHFAGIDPAKVSVIHEAADKIKDKAQAIPELKDKRFIMYVGRATPHKNLQRLVEAFVILSQQHPDLLLVFAGKFDANFKRLKEMAEQKGLAGKVVFTGYVDDSQLRWLYQNTAAYIFPSLSEGFGLPGLEAMAHGAPVVSSHATCLPEIYGEAVVYFDPFEVTDMAAKISEVISNEELRKKLIRKGHTRARKYSWSKTAEQTLAVYKEFLSKQ